MFDPTELTRKKSLRLFTTLKAGGHAELFYHARTRDDLADASIYAQQNEIPTTILGGGSNILPSDQGVSGLVILNTTQIIEFQENGVVISDSGVVLQDLFLKTLQANLAGLEYCVGIPGSVGGALVSNAGAYRSNISEYLVEIEVAYQGKRQWVSPDFMQFSYRDSILRKPDAPQATLLRIKFQLPTGDPKTMYDEAREYQRQRISKQPPSASAGSFFKNVYDQSLAQSLTNLPDGLKSAGVVPAGYLIESCGLKGMRHGGAMIGARHANFLLNVAGATATELRQLANFASDSVKKKFGVQLEEEVLYLGDWSRYLPMA